MFLVLSFCHLQLVDRRYIVFLAPFHRELKKAPKTKTVEASDRVYLTPELARLDIIDFRYCCRCQYLSRHAVSAIVVIAYYSFRLFDAGPSFPNLRETLVIPSVEE